jgi:hypothetical protein
MTSDTNGPEDEGPRDAASWAQPVSRLTVPELPSEAINLNVEGRKVGGPLQGFCQMWQKTYLVRLSGTAVTPTEVIKAWKENFGEFWPKGNRFYAPITGIAPGQVAVLNLTAPGGMPLSTGVMVIFADEESFTFMTPEGHMFSGWITFSAYERDQATVAQAQLLIRANDSLYEVAFRLGGSKAEDKVWNQTLGSLASYFGVEGQVQTTVTCIDPRRQWSQAKNVWLNAAIRSSVYTAFTPLRSVRKRIRRN